VRVFHRVSLSLVAHRPESDARSRVLRLKLVVVTIKIKPAFRRASISRVSVPVCVYSRARCIIKMNTSRSRNTLHNYALFPKKFSRRQKRLIPRKTKKFQPDFIHKRTFSDALFSTPRGRKTHTFTRARLIIALSKRATPSLLYYHDNKNSVKINHHDDDDDFEIVRAKNDPSRRKRVGEKHL